MAHQTTTRAYRIMSCIMALAMTLPTPTSSLATTAPATQASEASQQTQVRESQTIDRAEQKPSLGSANPVAQISTPPPTQEPPKGPPVPTDQPQPTVTPTPPPAKVEPIIEEADDSDLLGSQENNLKDDDNEQDSNFTKGYISVKKPKGGDRITKIKVYVSRARTLRKGNNSSALRFSLTATDNKGNEVTQLKKPLVITIDLKKFIDIDTLKSDERLYFSWINPDTGQSEELPITIDDKQKKLTVEINTLPSSKPTTSAGATINKAGAETASTSTFDTGSVATNVGWKPAWHDGQVNYFSGGFGWNYDIPVPAGPGGIKPAPISLSYNNQAVDNVRSWAQADGLGWGWHFDPPEIVYRDVTRQQSPDRNTVNITHGLQIVLNGATYPLVQVQDGSAASPWIDYYRTDSDQFWKIQWNRTTGDYWDVWLTDGTHYVFGKDGNSAVKIPITPTNNIPEAIPVAVRWRVSSIDYLASSASPDVTYLYETETFGQQLQYYQSPNVNAILSGASINDYLREAHRASYLKEINWAGGKVVYNWNYRTVYDPENNLPQTVYQNYYDPLLLFWQSKLLSSINVYGSVSSGAYSLMRSYVLTTEARKDPTAGNPVIAKPLLVLTKIQEVAPSGQILPPTQFDYTFKENKLSITSGSVWNKETFRYPRLTQIKNGYGGTTTINYGHSYGEDTTDFGYNYHITQKKIEDGMGGGTLQAYWYSESWENAAGVCYVFDRFATTCRDVTATNPAGGSFLGYRDMQAVDLPFNGSAGYLRSNYYRFYLPKYEAWELRGKLQAHEVRQYGGKDASGDDIWTTTSADTQTWQSSPSQGYYANIGNAKHVYLSQESNTHDALTTQTKYGYEHQNGNLVYKVEEGITSIGGDERTTVYGYTANTTNWILNKPNFVNTYTGAYYTNDSSQLPLSALSSQTLLGYDRTDINPTTNPTWNTNAPTKGLVTHKYQGYCYNSATGQLVAGTYTAGNGQLGKCLLETYAYDGWGNRTIVKDGKGNTTTTAFDAALYPIYPKTVTNAKGQVTTYKYYGIDTPANSNGLIGQLYQIVDPNQQVVTVWYDVFGRGYKAAAPGDDISSGPTVEYTYPDINVASVTPPFAVIQKQRTQNAIVNTKSYYDGIARVRQVRAQDVGGNERVVSTQYDDLSRVIAQTESYLQTAGGYVAPNWADTNLRKATTTYDGLDRPASETQSSGAVVQHGYGTDNFGGAMAYNNTGLFVHGTSDPNGHAKHYVTDGLGRTKIVREFTGTCYSGSSGCSAPWAKYTETSYGYDVLGNLTSVTDAKPSTTSVYYFVGTGLKRQMNDPDMGVWNYDYDAAGNLYSQSDNNSQNNFTFFYDALNRLTNKKLAGSDYAVFAYDEARSGYFNIGRRTTASKIGGSISAFDYDTRGRLQKQTDLIDGGSYVTGYGYDSADHITNMTYPESSEAVAVSYDVAGRPQSVTGGTSASPIGYASSATYNAAGKLRSLNNSNGYTQWWLYYGSNLDTPNWGATYYGRLRMVCVTQTVYSVCGDDANGTDTNPANNNSKLRILYGYDAVGNVTVHDERTPGAGSYMSFGYDMVDRLVSVSSASWTPNPVNETYAYDPIGNLTNKGSVTQNFNGSRPHAIMSTNTNLVFGYDNNGNMIQRQEKDANNNTQNYSQTWDADNHLKTVTNPSNQVTTYSYDADGNRIKKVDPSGKTIYIGKHFEKFFPGATALVAASVGVASDADQTTQNTLPQPASTLGGKTEQIDPQRFAAEPTSTYVSPSLSEQISNVIAWFVDLFRPASAQAVNSVSAANVAVSFINVISANVSGNTATRAIATDNSNCQGSGVFGSTTQAINSTGAYFEFDVTASTGKSLFFGLSNSDGGADWRTIKFAYFLRNDGAAAAYESGVTPTGVFGSYASGDKIRMEVRNNKVIYRRYRASDATWYDVYTSAKTFTYPLYLDVSLCALNDGVVNVQYGTLSTPTPTPTRTNTPSAPTNTPTRTNTPVPATPTATPVSTGLWVDDAFPAGSSLGQAYYTVQWVSSPKYSGNLAQLTPNQAGWHWHYFYNATNGLTLGANDVIYTYIYIDPATSPRMVHLSFMDNTGLATQWDHRAYWGEFLANYGVNGTNSGRYMGALPAKGQWVRLEVPASSVGMVGQTMRGVAYALYDGAAYWDATDKAASGVNPTATPVPPTATPTRTNTPVGATATSVPPTATASPTPSTGGSPTTTTYYFFGAQRIAKRVNGGAPTYLYGDNLGSANLTIDASGVVSSQRYKPFGEVRTGSVATDLTFTGQRRENQSYVGNLLDYGARFYSPGIGRFISADTIVPGAGNPQSLNRYSYVNNRPLNMVDPTGHAQCSNGDCSSGGYKQRGQLPSSPSPKSAQAMIPGLVLPSQAKDSCCVGPTISSHSSISNNGRYVVYELQNKPYSSFYVGGSTMLNETGLIAGDGPGFHTYKTSSMIYFPIGSPQNSSYMKTTMYTKTGYDFVVGTAGVQDGSGYVEVNTPIGASLQVGGSTVELESEPFPSKMYGFTVSAGIDIQGKFYVAVPEQTYARTKSADMDALVVSRVAQASGQQNYSIDMVHMDVSLIPLYVNSGGPLAQYYFDNGVSHGPISIVIP